MKTNTNRTNRNYQRFDGDPSGAFISAFNAADREELRSLYMDHIGDPRRLVGVRGRLTADVLG